MIGTEQGMRSLFFRRCGRAHLRPTPCDPVDCITCQTSLCVEFPRQEYQSGLPFPSPGDVPDPGIEHMYLPSPALAGEFFTTSAAWEVQIIINKELIPLGDSSKEKSMGDPCKLLITEESRLV